MFEYHIGTEKWIYICKMELWPDFAPRYGVQAKVKKKRKKKNG